MLYGSDKKFVKERFALDKKVRRKLQKARNKKKTHHAQTLTRGLGRMRRGLTIAQCLGVVWRWNAYVARGGKNQVQFANGVSTPRK